MFKVEELWAKCLQELLEGERLSAWINIRTAKRARYVRDAGRLTRGRTVSVLPSSALWGSFSHPLKRECP